MYMAAWRYEISLLMLKVFHSFAHISARSCTFTCTMTTKPIKTLDINSNQIESNNFFWDLHITLKFTY